VDRHIFQACPVWIYTQIYITNKIVCLCACGTIALRMGANCVSSRVTRLQGEKFN
jgi:hypothetical protein